MTFAPGEKQRNAAFTLIEMMVVIAIISILMGMMVAAVTTARRHSRNARANAAVSQLADAWRAYWITYGEWPWEEEGREATFDNLEPLLGDNSRNLVFLDLDLEQGESYLDPWRQPYYMTLRVAEVEDERVTRVTVAFPNRHRYPDL